ncbi:MAG: DUF2279 domain-containing protein [Chryseolinea sp.]
MAVIRILLFCLLFIHGSITAQDSLSIKKRRLNAFTVTSASAYAITLIGLNQLWYKDSPKESFHFFNDDPEWKQLDKVGHFYSSFYLSYGGASALNWCGIKPKRSDLIGSLIGFGVMLPIEILDGFSSAYGASVGDIVANTAGAAFYLGQKSLWNEVRIYPKFSFHTTHYAALRPGVLGDNDVSEFFKDYNGQTYWLCVDMDKFLRFPKWLNLAAGYGAQGMIYARDNQNTAAGYESPYRQYYLSLDIDFRSIKTRSRFVKALIFAASMIKLPSPTIEFSSKGTRFHALYF